MINRQRDTIFAPNIKMLVDKYLKTFAQGSKVEALANKFSYKFFTVWNEITKRRINSSVSN